jgi:hypothetical protein
MIESNGSTAINVWEPNAGMMPAAPSSTHKFVRSVIAVVVVFVV